MPPTKPWRRSPARWNAVCERFARSYWMRRLGCAAFTMSALAVAAQIAEAVTASTPHPPSA